MPRFDKEGFNPERRIDNDSRDRSVPADEDYYSSTYSNNQTYDDIIDNFQVAKDNEVQQTQYKYTPSKERENKSNKNKKIIISVSCVFLAIILVFTLFVGTAFGKITFDKNRENKYLTASSLAKSNKVTNILLLGVDARNPDDDTQSRSDTMMLVSIDSEHKCVKMISFLRDTWVYIPALDAKQRLNSACSADGYNGVVDTIEYNFGIDIDGYAVADFEMFKVLVDSIGGVEVEVGQAEADEVNNHEYRYDYAKLDVGTYKLTGEQALAYCRIRKIDTDFMRAYRQRTVMQSILSGVKSANPIKLISMVTKCAPYIETNLSKTSIISAGLSALSCISNIVETRVPFDNTWKYETISGNSVISIDLDTNKNKLIDIIYNKTAEEMKAENN